MNTRPPTYQIRVKGHLGTDWSDWFDGLTVVETENGETILSGAIPDQAALHGLLVKIRDLGLPLISVAQVELLPKEDPIVD